jgi:hypothetical protein
MSPSGFADVNAAGRPGAGGRRMRVRPSDIGSVKLRLLAEFGVF